MICKQFFNGGFGGAEDEISDVLVHRNPVKVPETIDGDSRFNYDAEPYVFSFASPYALRCLLQLKDNNMLAMDARNKYNAGTFRGSDNGNEFELLCLHGFKISGIEFLAHLLFISPRTAIWSLAMLSACWRSTESGHW